MRGANLLHLRAKAKNIALSLSNFDILVMVKLITRRSGLQKVLIHGKGTQVNKSDCWKF